MSIHYRTPFSPDFNFVVAQPVTFNGREYQRGEDFDKTNVEARLLKLLWDQRKLETVIPTIVIAKEPAAPTAEAAQPVKAKAARKAKAAEEEPPAAPTAPATRYRLEGNFGGVKIMDGNKVVRECATLDEAKAAMAELAGE